MGFGIFIFFALIVVMLTNRTLGRSRTINDQINQVYSPSVDALVRLRNMTVNSQMLIKHWALLESRADAPEKTALLKITEQDLPQLLDRVDTLMASWDTVSYTHLRAHETVLDLVCRLLLDKKKIKKKKQNYN